MRTPLYVDVRVDYKEDLSSKRHELVEVEYDLNCRLWPGEPRVMYCRDGSGYPGSPAIVEVLEATCTAVYLPDRDIKPVPRKMAAAMGAALLRRRGNTLDEAVYEDTCVAADEHSQDTRW